jgi:malonyl-CoA O-methyltransferase
MNNTIDKEKVRKRFGRSISSYNEVAVVQKKVARELMQKIRDVKTISFSNVLEIGCGTGFLTHELLQYIHPGHYLVNDLVDSMHDEVAKIASVCEFMNWSFIGGDAEKLIFPGSFDLVVSASAIQWFQDIAGFFFSVSKLMEKGNVFAFSTFGPQNFREIGTLQEAHLTYPSREELMLQLSLYFNILHCSEEIIPLGFGTPYDVLKHIKDTGVNAVSDHRWNRHALLNLETSYRRLYTNPDGSVNLTYHPIIMITQKK